MKLFFSIITLLVFSCILTSCQQEIDGNFISTGDNTNSFADSTVLSKFIQIDTTKPAGRDTVSKYEYLYDSRKRLSKILYSEEYTATTGGTRIATNAVTWHYNGSDTLPYKTTEITYDVLTHYDTTYHFYQNGFVVYDSNFFYWDGNLHTKGVAKYLNTGSNTFLSGYSKSFWTSPPDTQAVYKSGMISKRYTGDNIVYQFDTSANVINNGNGLTRHWEYEGSFDTHINPLYFTILPYPIHYEWISITGSQRNIATEQKTIHTDGSILNHYKYSHVYRADGYPVKTRVFDQKDPTSNTQYIYIYTKL